MAQQLAKERLELVEAKEVGGRNRTLKMRKTTGKEKAPMREVADFFFQMGTLLKAGVPILQSLELVADGLVRQAGEGRTTSGHRAATWGRV